MLPDVTYRQLAGWNATEQPFPQDHCVHDLVARQAAATPEATALVVDGQATSYGELNRRANQIAHYLQKLGVGPEVLVGVCLERSVELVAGLLAILKAGGAYVPLDPKYPEERLCYITQDAQVCVLLTQQALLPRLASQPSQVLCLDADEALWSGYPAQNPCAPVQVEHLAYVVYTSGSTGQPKGVEVTHRSLLNLIFWYQRALGVTAQDRASQLMSPAFDVLGEELWPHLTAGASVVLVDEDTRADARALHDWLLSQRITIGNVPRLLAEHLMSLEWPQQTALRVLLTGGEALQRHPPARLPFAVLNSYGPTETTILATIARVPPTRSSPDVPAIGRPIANTHIYLLDDQGHQVDIGEVGEIHIGGVGLARGYHHRPELTAERFIWHSFPGETKQRLYKTGDLARYRANGNLEFVGRNDDQIKLRGYRIEPNEIVSALNQHPAIQANVVIAREDTPGDKRLVIYLVLRPSQCLSFQEVRAFLKERLPEYMLPSACVVLDVLPVTAAGKIDRQALPRPEDSRQEEEDNPGAPTQIEHALLLGIWEELLSARPIGIRDNFFLLGGHSLLAVRLMARIEETFGEKITLATLFAGPTIEDIARALQQTGEHQTPAPIYTIQTGAAGRRPFFFLHGALEGGGFYCYHLAHELGAAQPFYALQPYRLEGIPVPPTFEEVAAAHLAQMRAIQPEGPYLLGGVCNGALIATEIARQIQAQGHTLDLLALVDPTHTASRFGLLGRSASYFLGRRLGRARENQFTLYLRIRHLSRYFRELVLQPISPRFRKWVRRYRGKPNRWGLALPKFFLSPAELREDWQTIFHCIIPGAIPNFQAVKLAFFWTEEKAQEKGEWRKWTQAEGAANFSIPGNHFDWTQGSINALAEPLSAYLNELQRDQVSSGVRPKITSNFPP